VTDASDAEGVARELPAHIETTIGAIAEMHARHQRKATPSQRVFAVMASALARPRFIGALTVGIAAWILLNLAAPGLGLRAWDPPPFDWLQGLVSVAALYTTTVILIAQKREDELASLREQLTLELAILSEQKSAKTIELIELLRRDLPSAPNRRDAEAEDLARAADPIAVAQALVEAQEALAAASAEDASDSGT
jgi:uncharacterized membrane protein